MHSLPVLQIRPNSLVSYSEILFEKKQSVSFLENTKNLTRGNYNGYLSKKSKQKITKYLEVWTSALSIKQKITKNRKKIKSPKLSFITLTLPSSQKHSDNIIKRDCLNSFIIYLKQSGKIKHYFWRAEPQKNGNIHFHLLVDYFINYKEIRTNWNAQLNKLGYIDEYRNKHQNMSENDYLKAYGNNKNVDIKLLKERYLKGNLTNWEQPNTTDIHSLRNIKNVTAYVIKYCTKNESGRLISGRLTGCSDEVRSLRSCTVGIGGKTFGMLQRFSKLSSIKSFIGEFHAVYFLPVLKTLFYENTFLYNFYNDYLKEMYNDLYGIKEEVNGLVKQIKKESNDKIELIYDLIISKQLKLNI